MTPDSAPDYLFIDAIVYAYCLGHVRHEEQKIALLAAARAATDAISFLAALENFGVNRRSELFRFVGEFLAAPAYFRTKYPGMIGKTCEGEPTEPFLDNPHVISLMVPILTTKQQPLFFETYWWFTHNHESYFQDPKKGCVMGLYASEPRDNASTIPRFQEYLFRLVNHKTKRISTRFEGFPADIVCAILKRAFA